jgi:hypothetical protein
VPDHGHLWGDSDNPAWIRQEQFLSGGIPSAAGGMIAQFGGCVFLLDSLFHILDNQEFDLTAYIPVSGARWVNVETNSSKVITYNEGDSVASREMLTYENIPLTASSKKLLFSIKTYSGQTRIIQGTADTDIFDPRFSGIATGGHATSIDWSDILNVPLVFPPDLAITDDVYPRKWIKSAAPTVDDDISTGYSKSDIWIDQAGGDAYICIDNADGAADWLKVSSSSGGVTSFIVEGRLAVVDNAAPVILITAPTSITSWMMYLESLGSSGSTIIDVILKRVGDADISIFEDGIYTVLPEIAYDDADHLLEVFPIITDFLAGDVLTLNIEQVAPSANQLTFAAISGGSGGGGLGLTVTDGVTTVDNVGQITIEGGTVIDGGGGQIRIKNMRDYILVRDEKAAGVNGGTFTAGSWQIRDINTEVSDAGGHCSIGSNEITLEAGTYEYRISAPAYEVNWHQARLYDVTNAEVIPNSESTPLFCFNGYGGSNCAVIVGIMVLIGSTDIRIEHRCETTVSGSGLGGCSDFGEKEIYTVAEFWKAA